MDLVRVNSCIYVTCFCICSEASFAILIFEFKDERIRVSIYDRLIKAHNQYGILVETDVRSSFQNSRASTEVSDTKSDTLNL